MAAESEQIERFRLRFAVEAESNELRWWEPCWSWFAAVRPYITGWGVLSPWLYIRLTIVAGLLVGASLYAVHQVAPGVPFPHGLVRALICGGVAVPAILLIQVCALLLTPHRVSVDRRGVTVVGSSAYTFKMDQISWVTVKPIERGRFVLSIEYRGKRAMERREIGLSSKVDPVELERLLVQLGWPAPVGGADHP